MLYSE